FARAARPARAAGGGRAPPGGRGPGPRGGPALARVAGAAARGDRGALGRAPRCCRLPLPARPLGGGDRGRPRRPAWDGQIANLARPRAAARGAGAGAMSALELRLRALGQALELPPEPDLAPRVLERLEGRRRPFPWRRGAVLALALLVLALGAAFAVPQARSAILRFFHLGGVTVIRVETLP